MQFHVSFLKVLSNVVWEDGWQKIQLGKSFLTVTEWHGGGGGGGVLPALVAKASLEGSAQTHELYSQEHPCYE